MSDIDARIQQAIAAFKANRRELARQILEEVVEIDEHNEQAWLWLSGCVDSAEEQRICLENVLTINPANQKAIKGLEVLKRKSEPRPAPPPPASRPSASPFSSESFDEYTFEQDDYGSAPAWDSGYQPTAPTSVDWGPAPGGGAAHGSGKHVQLPTDEEYDNWLANLPLGNGNASTGSPVFTDTNFDPTSGPFSAPPSASGADYHSPYETQDYGYGEAYNASLQPAGPSPFDTYDNFDTFSTYDSAGQPYAAADSFDAAEEAYPAEADAAPGYADEYAGYGFSGDEQPVFADEDEAGAYDDGSLVEDDRLLQEGAAFSAPAEPRPDSPPERQRRAPSTFGGMEADNVFGSGGVMLGSTSAAPPTAQLFKAIPEEIQVSGGGGLANGGLLAGLLLLGGLNIVSILLLVLNLTG